MGWDGPQGKPLQAVSTAEPSVSVKPKRPAGRMPAVCRGQREKMPPAFVLHLTIRRGRMQERQCPITENRLSCMETVPEDSKFS